MTFLTLFIFIFCVYIIFVIFHTLCKQRKENIGDRPFNRAIFSKVMNLLSRSTKRHTLNKSLSTLLHDACQKVLDLQLQNSSFA